VFQLHAAAAPLPACSHPLAAVKLHRFTPQPRLGLLMQASELSSIPHATSLPLTHPGPLLPPTHPLPPTPAPCRPPPLYTAQQAAIPIKTCSWYAYAPKVASAGYCMVNPFYYLAISTPPTSFIAK
jgi:hypothetical protein